MANPVKKAIFPVAGLGTRFLPATKAIPKEMLPIIDKPLIQYAVEEAIAAGVTQLIFITSSSKTALEKHFDNNPVLEQALLKKNDMEKYNSIHNIIPSEISCVYVRQKQPKGLGHAIWCTKDVIGNEPFAVLLADDLIDGRKAGGCLSQMINAYQAKQASIIAVEEIPLARSANYGVVALDAIPEQKNIQRITHIVEKPQPENAPSNLGVVGRYILMPEIFSHLENLPKGSGNEIQLTDAIERSLKLQSSYAFNFAGKRFDCGQTQGFVDATVHYANS